MRLMLIGALLAIGCSGTSDPCAGLPAQCVAVEVHGAPASLDELDVSATQLPGRSVSGRAALSSGAIQLPVQFAALLPVDFSGPVLVELVGAKNGLPVAYGRSALTLPPSGQRLKVTLAPLGTVGDGGAPDDLARFHVGTDLAMNGTQDLSQPPVDLAGLDLAVQAPCTAGCTVSSFSTQTQHLNPARTAFGSVVVGRNVYLLGGQDGAAMPTASVQRAPINPDGTLGTFNDAGVTLQTARELVAAAATNQFVYVVAGSAPGPDIFTPTVFMATVERAAINSDGSLGAFQTLTSQLATARDSHAVAIVGSTLVVLGGTSNGTALTNSVEIATILSDGSLGAFGAGPSLSSPRSPSVVRTSGFLYVIAGENSGDATVERATISGNSLGSFITQGITLRTRRVGQSATLVGDDVYVMGGGFNDVDAGTAATFPTSIERAHVDGSGTLANFSTASISLQTGRGGHGAVYTGNSLYVLGGFNGGTGPLDTIERAPVQ